MTHSTAINSTITKQQQATSVSPLEQSGSNKNEMLKGFKAGKLRKNAKKKIADLLSIATCITLKTQSMGMDDCYSYNAPRLIDVAEFWAWYDAEYSELEIYLYVKDGLLVNARFSDCPYHFSDDVVLTFDAVEEKNTPVEVEEKEPVSLRDLSQVTFETPETLVIKKISIVWSESNHFEDGEVLTLAQYDEKSTREALEVGRGQGYAKTKLTVHSDRGVETTFRHDIDADYPTLTFDLAARGIKAVAVATKPRTTYEHVIEALAQGYISPLNHEQKHPEPIDPTPTNSRNVVSLGDYQERIEAKRDRLEARAEKATAESTRYYLASKERASHIPFGQPILVGHHSEGRARRDADRIFNDMGKSVAASNKAGELESRAASIGTGGIASDDPEAIQKLKAKLTSLETSQETMKAVNNVIRSKHMSDADKIEYMVKTHRFSECAAKKVLEPDHVGRIGFASYQLQNNNATIRSTRERIKELETLHNQTPLDVQGEVEGLAWALFEEEGRVKFSFDDKPSESVRALIKSYGFKWSRYSGAWVRKITPNAIASAELLAKALADK